MENQSTDPKQALVDKIKQSTNILVTVTSNPTVDQLAACLGLTIWLNKIEKHATAVFSGDVPSTLEFLQPAETLEKNTDSLRDFIISLDKSKADKLRYKVEDKVVKIFITPYRTSLSADDLEYSQGDFNVDMVIALGVHAQEELDAAITAHGRILHDATVATITTGEAVSQLGSIAWHDSQASSLSELVVDLGNLVDQTKLDGQIATALLTGIVAETERFSNDKTTPQTMSISAQLMSAGANQQLVASKLDQPASQAPAVAESSENSSVPEEAETKSQDGTLEIEHPVAEELATPLELPAPEVAPVEAEASVEEAPSNLVTEPPMLGGTLTANTQPEDLVLEPSSDPLSQTGVVEQPLLDRDSPAASVPQPAPPDWLPPQPWMAPPAPATEPASESVPGMQGETLADIEREVGSTHLADQSTPDVGDARDEVMKAIDSTPPVNPEPIQALNAQPIDLTSPQPAPAPQPSPGFVPAPPAAPFDSAGDGTNAASTVTDMPTPDVSQIPAPDPELTGPVEQPFTLPVPGSIPPATDILTSLPPVNDDPNAPPPVPPPLMPPGFPPAR